MKKDIEILEEWIKIDREMRNNSLESDFDKFCEEKNIAIENLIKRNKELGKTYNTAYNLGKVFANKQWEARIKEKIKELFDTKGDFATYIATSERIKALQELLYEEVKQ